VFDITYNSITDIKQKKSVIVPNQLLERRIVRNNIFLVNKGTRLLILGGNNQSPYSGEYFDLVSGLANRELKFHHLPRHPLEIPVEELPCAVFHRSDFDDRSFF
jgi:hypothetical protein